MIRPSATSGFPVDACTMFQTKATCFATLSKRSGVHCLNSVRSSIAQATRIPGGRSICAAFDRVVWHRSLRVDTG